MRQFKELPLPLDPCFVVMQRKNCIPHIGIYVYGRVLHLSHPHVEYQPVAIASRGFTSVRFYK